METVMVISAIALFLAFWIVPVVLGVRAALTKGVSPHWMWFGLHPFGAWIAFLVIRFGVRPRKRCPQCAERLLSHAKVCAYCGNPFSEGRENLTSAGTEPRRRTGFVITAVILGFALFAGVFAVSLFLVVSEAFDHSEVVGQALARAQREPALQGSVGMPIEKHGFLSGSINESGPSGDADLEIPVRGPRGEGELFVVAGKSAGVWTFTTFTFQAKGGSERIELLHSASPRQGPSPVSQ